MAAPLIGRPGSTVGGGVRIALSPPLSFILRQTGAFRRSLENLEPLWDMFKPIMSQVESELWQTEGHGDWPPLSPVTVARKGHSQILVDTGDLRASLVDPARAAHTTRQQMTWGTSVPYAAFHQEGGRIPGRPPKRQVIDIRVEDRRKFETALVTYLNLQARRTIGRI